MPELVIVVGAVVVWVVGLELAVRAHRRWTRGQIASTLIAHQVEREIRQASGKAPSLSTPAAKGFKGRHDVVEMVARRDQMKRAGR